MILNNHRYYPSAGAQDKIIFFLCPHGVTIRRLNFVIKQLLRKSYGVHAYEYPQSVIEDGDPSLLPQLIQGIRNDIETKIKAQRFSEVGIFGSSLGSFIAYNLLDIESLQWVIMNTGGDLAIGVWGLKKARIGFQSRSISKEVLTRQWHHLQNPTWAFTTKPRVFLFAGSKDRLATVAHARIAHAYMLAQGVDSRLFIQKGLNHTLTLLANFSQAGRLASQIRRK